MNGKNFAAWVLVLLIGGGVLAAPGLASASSQDSTVEVTFTKHVLPIMQRACQQCHRPGSVAPMSLLTYEEVRPWARAIKDRTAQREMPPWYIERNVGVRTFKEDASLTDEEIATIGTWVDAGAPRGNPADAPPPVQLASLDEWRIGTPDWIVEIPECSASDRWGIIRHLSLTGEQSERAYPASKMLVLKCHLLRTYYRRSRPSGPSMPTTGSMSGRTRA